MTPILEADGDDERLRDYLDWFRKSQIANPALHPVLEEAVKYVIGWGAAASVCGIGKLPIGSQLESIAGLYEGEIGPHGLGLAAVVGLAINELVAEFSAPDPAVSAEQPLGLQNWKLSGEVGF